MNGQAEGFDECLRRIKEEVMLMIKKCEEGEKEMNLLTEEAGGDLLPSRGRRDISAKMGMQVPLPGHDTDSLRKTTPCRTSTGRVAGGRVVNAVILRFSEAIPTTVNPILLQGRHPRALGAIPGD
ncbi:hypothetical protein PAAG_05741 [Paracoccidioides lutzii Pb01]|uniref:Uncharacterized protein n=1 Tax=Paracoccidioides lutzii (strain ATCC MYA-826 / Pb01) TaxID=502779 RepID=C1H4Q1_PARBA|nr:hypothetical protein PAAG_05741 [Paracoccidioides lutzii Pb01]EEH34695.2 hypothetical protein PAAG_05741 [Paracoccidioides lutzii Pb01]